MSDETRILALIGDPVSHSLSPRMQNAGIGAAGIDAVYIPLRTKRTAFAALVGELLRNGGACNVTSPFKDDAFSLGGEHSDVARRTRSVNCVWGSAERPTLDNTDVDGVRQALRALLPEGGVRSARVVGTGGSARAAAVALTDEWPGIAVLVSSRDPARAEAFVQWADEAVVACVLDDGRRVDIEIWARPQPDGQTDGRTDGQGDEPGPIAFLDLNYRAGGTALVLDYAARGVRASDGREVLLGQGFAAFERFFGMPAPLEVMRAAVEYALRP